MLTLFKNHFQNQNPSLWTFDGELSDIRDNHFTSKLLLNSVAEPNGRRLCTVGGVPVKKRSVPGSRSPYQLEIISTLTVEWLPAAEAKIRRLGGEEGAFHSMTAHFNYTPRRRHRCHLFPDLLKTTLGYSIKVRTPTSSTFQPLCAGSWIFPLQSVSHSHFLLFTREFYGQAAFM